MIISKLMGGLGNQMFQYAAGRSLAHKHGVDLKLDISYFQSCQLRKYALEVFNIGSSFATQEEIEALTTRKVGIAERIYNRIRRRPARPPASYIDQTCRIEPHVLFDSEILNLSDNIYLDGYWQSEKYFIDIESIIRREFAINIPLNEDINEIAKEIASCESVNIHIRRSDYVSNKHTNQYHGVCSLDYYYQCIEQLVKIIKKPYFFIFSDDPQWVRDNLKTSYPFKIIEGNLDKGYEDLRLMSLCRHHIIANSSFSWWGAWLNPQKDKIVFVPKQWFAQEDLNINDIVPDSWTKI
ncbi:Alpha-1,2-fucosyltransferase [hydrothermal vent metagenome]|uniref:Alpha-1,2-fucosyltransferase n=1 Tax=hydrothermal vent metagenome TaxID=652676 RepID=A0A3B1CW50_9ZZZZ